MLTSLARTAQSIEQLDSANYEERTLLKLLGMRRTVFIVPLDLAAVVQASSADALISGERKLLAKYLEEGGVADDGAAWIERVAAATIAALTARGEALATELSDDVPELKTQIPVNQGKSYGGTIGASTRVLFLLGCEARIARTRPRGTWISSLHRWSTMENWLGAPLPSMPLAEARARLIGAWLRTYGPVTTTDTQWWSGWSKGEAVKALAANGAVEVRLDEGTGWVLPDDLDDPGPVDPWAALLPSLDQAVMGWKERRWTLGEHEAEMFDRSGNVGPTVWVNGRVVGMWVHRSGGDIAIHLFEDVGSDTRALIDAAADALNSRLGGTAVAPRFPTPIDKRLRA